MKFGWPISLTIHAVFAVGGLIAFSTANNANREKRVIPVELLTIDDLNDIRAAIKSNQIKMPEEPMQLETPMENAQDVGAASSRSVESQPEIIAQPDADSESTLKSQPEAPSFDLDSMEALINKTRETQDIVNQQKALQAEQDIYELAARNREFAGQSTRLTIDETTALMRAMKKCWNLPAGMENPEELIVKIRVKLRSDGYVREARIVDTAKTSNPHWAFAERNARDAIKKCEPYSFLPIEKYESWKDMILRFKPEM